LLNGYLDGLSFHSSELADLIVKQVKLGTMITIEDPEETKNNKNENVLGFCSILNI